MAKQSGVGSSLFWQTADISGDVGALDSIEVVRGVLPVTGIDKSAEERILGLRDGSLSFTSYWNTAAGAAHLSLSNLPRTDVQATVAIGSTVGSAAASLIGKQTTYAPSRGADGSLVVTTGLSANGYPLEWGELLTTGKQTFASGSLNGTSVDGAASSSFGAAAWLHVFSLGSGTPTITITDSANDIAFATLAPTALSFSPVAAGVSRAQTGTTATIRRYVRVEVTGTYTDLVCVVNFVRYTESAA